MRRAAVGLLIATFALTLAPGPWRDERVSDIPLYRGYAAFFLDGVLPYRDVGFEYPPLAAAVIALPGVVGTDERTYRIAFAAMALTLAVAVVLLVGELAARTGGRRREAMIAAALAPLLTGAMIRTHFDLAPVVLALAALLLLCAERPRAAFAVLGLAVMTKGFPIVVVPVALAWLGGRGERRAALAASAALAVTVGALAATSVALSPSGALDAVTYHLERPVQIESAPASVLLALDGLGAGQADVVESHRSAGLEHPAAGVLSALFAALLVAATALAAAACATRGDPRALVLGSLAAVAAFAALGKVLSPQFLIWVVPLAALALAWRRYALAAAAAVAIVLTLLEFPARYADVVAREPAATWLVGARNAVLLVALALALRELRASPLRAGAVARSPWLARRRRPRPARR